MATIFNYSKSLTGILGNIKITNEYKKDFYIKKYKPTLVKNELALLTETYTIEDITNKIEIVITHSGISNFEISYEIFLNTVSLNFPSSFFSGLNQTTSFDGKLEILFDNHNLVLTYIDSNDIDTVLHTETDIIDVDFDDPDIYIDFSFASTTNSIEYLELEISEFKVEYDIIEETQDVGDIIYPITSINDISSNHSITNFQTQNLIDFVVKDNEMFITTGTKLISLRYVTLPNESSTKKIVLVAQEVDKFAYEPNTQEVAIGGLNLIKHNPFESISDVDNGVTFNPDFARIETKYGITNVDNILKCFVTLKSGSTIDDYDFKIEYQKYDLDDLTVWTQLYDFTTGEEGRKVVINFSEPYTYNFRITMRESGTTTNDKYAYIFGYVVDSLDKNKGVNLSDISAQINSCLNIVLYYNKIILYNNNTPNIYKSFSGKETWFTISGVIPLNALRQEIVEKLIPADNALIGFTKNSIVALVGKGDDIQLDGYPYEPFNKFITLDGTIGAIAPNSVIRTNDGRLIFLSNNGLYIAYNIDLNTEVIQTKKIDDDIDNIVLRSENANAILYNNKYYLCYPDKNRIIKWHFVYNDIFTLDESEELVFRKMYIYDNIMYGISTLNKIMQHRRLRGEDLGNQIDATQLTANGNFTKIYYLETVNGTITVENNIISLLGNNTDVYSSFDNTSYAGYGSLIAGNDYYLTFYARVLSENCQSIDIDTSTASDVDGLEDISPISNPIPYKWYRVSGIYTAESNVSGSILFEFKQTYLTVEENNGAILQVKKLMLLKVVDTQMVDMETNEIDLIVNEYCEGECTFYKDGTNTSTLENIDDLKLSNLGLFIDDENYFTAEIESKNYSFGYDEFVKKLYEFVIGFNSVKDNKIELFINVYADNVPIISTKTDGVITTEDVDSYDIVSDYTISGNNLDLHEPNAVGNLQITLGEWELSEEVLGFFAQTFRYFEIMDTKESMRIKFNIKHQQDSYVLLSHFGFIFEVGYIPKDSGFRL